MLRYKTETSQPGNSTVNR